MNTPPPLPEQQTPPERRNREEPISNFFWTLTIISLCLVGILLLLAIITASSSGERNAAGGSGASGVAGDDGSGNASESDAGTGGAGEQERPEEGSSNLPAESSSEELGNLGQDEATSNSLKEPVEATGASVEESNPFAVEAPDAGAPESAMANSGLGAGNKAGDAPPIRKPTISFAEPNVEDADEESKGEVPEPTAASAPESARAKGQEIGLFSKPEAGFFGVNVEAESVAFVIDASSSMLGPSMESFRPKFDRLKEELMRSVKSLSEKQVFSVVMFNDYPLVDQNFLRVRPTGDKVKDLEEKLINTFPIGGTDPTGAMELMLKDDYDVIFLLSDGEFDANAVEWIRRQNSGHIVICTICLGGDAVTLQRIAKEAKGRYKSVR